MKKIKFKKYGEIDDYHFDKGFDLTKEEIEVLKDEENELFKQSLNYVLNHNGKLLVKNEYRSFFCSEEDNYSLPSGKYMIRFGHRNDNNIVEHDIYEDEDTSEGCLELLKDTYTSSMVVNQLDDYRRKREHEESLNQIWIGSDMITDDWKTAFQNMTKEEIIEQIKDTYKQKIEEKIEEEKTEKKEREKDEISVKEVETKFAERENFEYEKDNSKWGFNYTEYSLTYTRHKKKQFKVKFKTLEDFERLYVNGIYYITSMTSGHDIKYRIADNKISFKWFVYSTNDLGEEEERTIVEMDFDNNKINGVKVSKSKMNFLFNNV